MRHAARFMRKVPQAKWVRQHDMVIRENALQFRKAVQKIIRAVRAGVVDMQRYGDFEITEHGTLFD